MESPVSELASVYRICDIENTKYVLWVVPAGIGSFPEVKCGIVAAVDDVGALPGDTLWRSLKPNP